MEALFLCRECGQVHADPADATLGHLVVCLSCATSRNDDGDGQRETLSDPLAA